MPATLNVTAGQKIIFEFENQDDVDHNIVSKDNALFGEVTLGGSQKRTVEWTAPSTLGPLNLVCTYHPGMEMTLNVK